MKARLAALQSSSSDLEILVLMQTRVVAAGRSLSATMQAIVDSCCELMGFEGATVELLRGETLVYEAVAGPMMKDFSGMTLEAKTSLSGLALREMQTLVSQDSVNDPRANREAMRKIGIGSSLLVPFFVEGRAFGVLKVVSSQKGFFQERHKRILEYMGEFLSMALEAAREHEAQGAKFENLANSLPQLAWMADRDGSIYWYNKRWYEYTGMTLQEMKGWGWEKVHEPKRVEEVKKSWRAALKDGVPWEDTFPLRRKDGEWRWFLTRAVPVFDTTGKIDAWFGTNTDITENLHAASELRESKEAAEQASAAKTQFLANMSHELRTPLAAVIGFSNLLKDDAFGEKERAEFLQIVERNSQNLLRLVDDILDLTKVEAGKISIENQDILLSDLLNEFSLVMTRKAHEGGIQFTLESDGTLPNRVTTDPLRLKQILSNIVGNAMKFTKVGSVVLKVSGQDGILQFSVTDTGPGISAADAAKLFKPFGQVDPSMTREYGGSGLGLVLSRRMANLLGGDVVLKQSKPGHGSEFVVTIRSKDDGSMCSVATQTVSEPRVSRGPLDGMRILLVDDAPENRALIKIYLSKAGARVDEAVNGSQGFERARTTHPDLVLMDIQMPVMNGLEATHRLREEGFSKPILAFTAHAMPEERERCLRSGCDDFLTKPITKEELVRKLSKFRVS